MDTEQRLALIRKVGEEILTEPELRTLLETKTKPVAYNGFEPSGMVHIAQGLLSAIHVNHFLKAGVAFTMYAADWHAWANNKLGGDLEKIQVCSDYLIEVWKASGMDVSRVNFVRASSVVSKSEFWKKVLHIARMSTVNRIIRTGQIMGRKEGEMQSAAQILYPCMQAADIFELGADIAQLGMDQRKVNVLARELGPKLGLWKPVVVSHHMLLGLTKVQSSSTDAMQRTIDKKMSKSKPNSAVFMTDSAPVVVKKLEKAHCPEKTEEDNPVLEYAKYIVFGKEPSFELKRAEKFGGTVCFESYAALRKAYLQGDIHPADLKQAVAERINTYLAPVRQHFKKNKKAMRLLEQVKGFQ